MKRSHARSVRRWVLPIIALPALLLLSGFGPESSIARGGDWPQWRGPNRDAKVTDFTPPAMWPKELKQKWKVTVGEGVASPALVGDKLFVFAHEGGNDVTRCLNAADGKEVWKDTYTAPLVTGVAAGRGKEKDFAGPRSSPTVADGKVITFGVVGKMSCLNADDGKLVWRIETGGKPTFSTSSSPIVVDKLVVAQVGGEKGGGITAYNLADGKEKWKWTGEGTAYASPVLLTVDGTKMIVAETNASYVGIGLADGKLLWKSSFAGGGKGGYNACTPVVEGQTVIFSGDSRRGTKAIKIEKSGDTFTAKELWKNEQNSVKFNTPVFRKGLVVGITDNDRLFCISSENGEQVWAKAISGKGGYGSVVDAGKVMFVLTPSAQLRVFEPDGKDYKELASYKVADTDTYAYPIIAENRIFVKDFNSLTLWTIE